ncbi:MAG: hypothetical protein IID16_10410 [Candidatus Marinimicrobia bacterium]|nr:hypothetical protein [Candidatus Neomarinimicrobiota bacterium]
MKVLITDPITDGGKSLPSNAGIEIIDLTDENSKILENTCLKLMVGSFEAGRK